MDMSRRQWIAMVVLVALPLCVTAITAFGLGRLDRILQSVAEEYAEVRVLHPIDLDLQAATIGLGSEDPSLRAGSRRALEHAEASLVEYLASQYDSVASEQHQAIEAGHASVLLKRLQGLLGAEGQQQPPARQAEIAAQLRSELSSLQQTADSGVRGTHQDARAARESTLTRVVLASLVSAIICAALLAWTTRTVNLRLRDLHQRLAARTSDTPAPAARGLGGVVTQIEELNARMLQKIEESGRELLRRERLVGIGLLAADVAHEINNPVNAMLGLSELGLKAVEPGPVDEPARAELADSLRIVRREALRCKAIVERLMAMVRSDRKPGWFDATRLVQETVDVARAARPDRAPCFEISGANLNVCAFGAENDVRQILLTLLINAADAVPADGRIEVDAAQTQSEVWLRVRDNGRGFSQGMRETFFTPFKSYSKDGRGAGLGLSIAQALAEGMGASLRPFSNGPGTGSTFILAIQTPQGAA